MSTRMGDLPSQMVLAHGQQNEIAQMLSEFVPRGAQAGITSSLTKERLLAQCDLIHTMWCSATIIRPSEEKLGDVPGGWKTSDAAKKESCWGQGCLE